MTADGTLYRLAAFADALGAAMPAPLPAMQEPGSGFIDPYDLEQVTAFLSNPDRQIPDRIARLSSTRQ